uniref:Synaptotagmin-16-like n=1 Tax=Phallusia mammillata TaxID=59560 RepID=A0A6F9DUW3_9ASCI|nr:synaptotagmin-16-like [Phallusia mammillata]
MSSMVSLNDASVGIKSASIDTLDSLDDDSLCDPDEFQEGKPRSKASLNESAVVYSDASSSNIGNLFRALSRSIFTVQSNNSTKSATTVADGQAKSYDESGDSESSSDSEEETIRHMQKSIRRSRISLRSSLSQQKSTAGSHQSLTPGDISGSSFTNSLASLTSREQVETPLSLSPIHGNVNVAEWDLDAGQSNLDLMMHEDEVAAAMAVKPLMEGEEDDTTASPGNVPISACGTLEIALQYSVAERKLQITVVEANDLPSKDRGGASIIQVRLVVLPTKRKRYKTKVQHINSPRFAETFKLSQISPEDLKGLGLRLRLYGIGKVKDRLIGEATVRFDELNLIKDPQLTVTLQLEPRMDVNRSEPDSSAASQSENDMSSISTLTHGGSLPELLLSLSYNEMTGRLCVEVVKGSHFRNLAMSKPPDTYVKIVLLNSSCQEMAQSKTTVRRSQPNPVFKETFYFQVALFQLAEVSLMVSVHCTRTIKRKFMIGWISLGQNSSSESDEQHWLEMREAKGKVVSRWHTLVES